VVWRMDHDRLTSLMWHSGFGSYVQVSSVWSHERLLVPSMSKSPFTNILDSYYPPAAVSDDTQLLSSYIKQEEVALRALEIEIEEAQKHLDSLRSRYRERTTELHKHKSLCSPIKKLPPDILTSIFLACTPQKVGFKESSLFSRTPLDPATELWFRDPPPRQLSTIVKISHVCRTWRQLSLKTGNLWTKIGLYPPDCGGTFRRRDELPDAFISKWKRGIEREIEGLQACLERSGSCPLSIAFSSTEPTASDPIRLQWLRKLYEKLMDTLLGSSSRWRSMECDITLGVNTQPILQFLFMPRDSLPLLEEVKLSVAFFPGTPDSQDIRNALRKIRGGNIGLLAAARIRSIAITDYWSPLQGMPVNWANITHLAFGGYTQGISSIDDTPFPGAPIYFEASDALQVLKGCPSLVSCRLVLSSERGWMEPKETLSQSSVTTLPALTFFHLQFQVLPPSFAASLNLPSLRELRLVSSFVPDSVKATAAAGIANCLLRWGSSLKSARFNYTALSAAQFEECLTTLVGVENLYLDSFMPPVNNFSDDQLSSSTSYALFSGDLLQKMTPCFDKDGGLASPLPILCKLRKFTCKAIVSGELPVQDALDFIVARTRLSTRRHGEEGDWISPLEEVRLENDANIGSLLLEPKLKGMGVDMDSFKYSTTKQLEQRPELRYFPPYVHPYEFVDAIPSD